MTRRELLRMALAPAAAAVVAATGPRRARGYRHRWTAHPSGQLMEYSVVKAGGEPLAGSPIRYEDLVRALTDTRGRAWQ